MRNFPKYKPIQTKTDFGQNKYLKPVSKTLKKGYCKSKKKSTAKTQLLGIST